MPDIPRPPRNFDEIKLAFGNPEEYMNELGELKAEQWEHRTLGSLYLPAPLSLSWLPEVKVKRIRCHRLILPVFDSVYKAIHAAGLWAEIDPFAGCYCFRQKSSFGSELSTHSWGIAVDHRPEQNPAGSEGSMHPKVVEIFREYGFTWGGDWAGSGKDAMHWQFAENY